VTPADALVDLRRARRARRIENIHWVDALYQAYLTALLGTLAIVFLSSIVGDNELDAAAQRHLLADGPAFLGIVVAVAIAIGLRSGARGGPLAIEAADVRHVLLAPIDRGLALRAPALRQLRFALFVGAVTGGIAGEMAARRLPRSPLAWIVCGALFGAATVALALGAGLAVSGRRVPRWIASTLALVLVAWAVADAAGAVPGSPTAWLGHLALWPLEFDALALVPLALAVVLVVVGVRSAGGLSIESAQRRSTLVGQLRFAATLQDVRTVIVLRRQLAQELPRLRPWLRVRRGLARPFPVWRRGWHGVFRWPAARLGRLLLLGIAAGLALRGVWDGTTPLIVVAGLAMFLAGLDAVESLAQESDHPGLRDAFPVETGSLHLRHLPGAVIVSFAVALIAAAAGVAVHPSRGAFAVAALSVLPGAFGATAGGVTSVVMGAPAQSDSALFLPPEITGMRIAARTAWPPLVAIFGCVPVLAARAADNAGQDAYRGAAAAAMPMVIVFGVVCAWVRFRDRAKAWWKAQLETAFPPKPAASRG
jgi:hypothetical protein